MNIHDGEHDKSLETYAEIADAVERQEMDEVLDSIEGDLDREAEAQAGDFVDADKAEQPPLQIYLASSSPRRRQLLEEAGVKFTVRPPAVPVDETLSPDEEAEPAEACKKLAQRKAGAVVEELLNEGVSGLVVVIGADTMVVKGNRIYGKPKNLDDAKRMLRELSGGAHRVISAVSVWMIVATDPENVSVGLRTFFDESMVVFR
ncbi:MAG: Maf family protein, partial [Eggerthellaceae bacterium]|nr:Maf family protein [Eggerthellaceae bacterium]